MTSKKPKLAVVVKGWPRLSETFIAQELVALEGAGHDLDLWSLRFPTDKKRHPLHERLKAKVRYLPEYLHQEPFRVLRGVLKCSVNRRFWTSLRVWLKDLGREKTRNRARRFGQACVLAAELPRDTAALYAHFLHTPASVARYASIIRGVPWSVSAHAKDIWTSPEWEKREKLQANTHGATFLATCTGGGAKHLQGLADRSDRVELIYHGLDLSRFPEPPAERPQSGKVRFLSVGRLVEKKGFDRLLESFALLPADLDWTWEHIGGGGLSDTLEAKAKSLGVSNKITWRGACDQPEVIDAMRRSDIFVLPSRIAVDGDRDGLPNVLMEAASQKLCLLSTPVSAIPEFITDGQHGILSSDDPANLAEALTNLSQNAALRVALADSAYERLTSHFLMQPGIQQLDHRLQAMFQG
ncbi:glycosyltransferase family 4 protein [Shimia abyssi]|uniref:Glycosyltransferase involved in cell wall biosynthesis n=1 Tax=Shimia abyssi TaxID=1662395 RepID=A0A2P8FAS6_9RHOB|nr:glycosyltransferase family 4 protein [Shimia abyssi]PSL18752.1 glycosyltransferase involved in cell wall biosynthesis [Shimia abyssi]